MVGRRRERRERRKQVLGCPIMVPGGCNGSKGFGVPALKIFCCFFKYGVLVVDVSRIPIKRCEFRSTSVHQHLMQQQVTLTSAGCSQVG